MRVLVFSHYYYPEGNAPASRMAALCAHWARNGHQVEVITCVPNVPNGVVYEGYRNQLCQTEILDGVQVTRVWSYLSANQGTVRRIVNFISYMVMAVLAAWFRRRPDVVIATSPQFFCGWAGLIAARLRIQRVPFILEIRDLWPDSIIAVGAIANRYVLRSLYWLEKWLYRGASHIVTVGDGYCEDLVAKGVPREKLSVIPNGVDRDTFWPRQAGDFLSRYGIHNQFTCAYVGTIGMAAGLEIAIEAAERLRASGRDDVAILLVGDGAEREKLERIAGEKGLTNLVFTGRLPKAEIPEILAATDVCFVHLRKADLFTRVLPSKIFEMAAMKKPIILGVQGHAARLIQDACAGICIEPENSEQFVSAVCSLASDPEGRLRLGQAGHDYVVANYDRASLADKYLRVLYRLVEQPRPDAVAEPVLSMVDGAGTAREGYDAAPVEKAA